MADIECLVCRESIRLPEYIDAEDYDGEVVCQKCGSLLHIKLVKSKVRKYEVVERDFSKAKMFEWFEELKRAYLEKDD